MPDSGRRQGHFRPGRHDLSREFVVEHQRKRILEATAALTAAQGYADTSVSQIVKRAGIARNTFYEHYEGKEECFLAAFDAALAEALLRVQTASEAAGGPWSARVHAGIAALLEYIVTHPAHARMCLVEAQAAGPAGAQRYEGLIQAFVPLVRLGRRESATGEALPPTMEETLVGGIAWILYQQIAKDETEFLQELLPELVEFVLTPYIGVPDARRAAGKTAGEPAG